MDRFGMGSRPTALAVRLALPNAVGRLPYVRASSLCPGVYSMSGRLPYVRASTLCPGVYSMSGRLPYVRASTLCPGGIAPILDRLNQSCYYIDNKYI